VDLLLIRHAEPVRVENLVEPADPPLSERGAKQSEQLAACLAGESLHELWTSPMRRARETAEVVAARTGLPVQVADGLTEWDQTSPVYIPIEELRAAKDERYYALISGEAFAAAVDPAEFAERVIATIEGIIVANSGRAVAVICHGGVINTYLSWMLGRSEQVFFEPLYTGINRVRAARTGERTILALNEACHLRPQGR